jgi:hypothetical protein
VRDVATLEPVTCAPGDDLETAMGLMRQHEVQRLPVVDDGEIVGVIRSPTSPSGGPTRSAADSIQSGEPCAEIVHLAADPST